MLVGVGMILAYHLVIAGRERPMPHDQTRLVAAAKGTLDRDVDCIRSGPVRRKLLGEFVRRFFDDLSDLKKIDGLPEGLLAVVSSSAFGPPSGDATTDRVQPQRPPLSDRKRDAVALLQDPEVSALSDREIGRRCGLDGKTIKALRQKLSGDVPQVRKVGRKGKSYFIDVSRIGKAPGQGAT